MSKFVYYVNQCERCGRLWAVTVKTIPMCPACSVGEPIPLEWKLKKEQEKKSVGD